MCPSLFPLQLTGSSMEKMKNSMQAAQTRHAASIFLLSRILLGVVIIFNLECALEFIVRPANYITSFDLSGSAGMAVIRSIGILFIMWNIPYMIGVINPTKHFICLLCALIMQGIGVIGESWVYLTIPDLVNTRLSISRFILFDFIGFIFILIATILIRKQIKNVPSE